jgi:hypothetical protein
MRRFRVRYSSGISAEITALNFLGAALQAVQSAANHMVTVASLEIIPE